MKKLLLRTLVLGLFVQLRAGWLNEASVVGLFTGTSIGAMYVGKNVLKPSSGKVLKRALKK